MSWPPGWVIGRVRRAFIAARPGAVLTTQQIAEEWTHPREDRGGKGSRRRRNRLQTVRRAVCDADWFVPAGAGRTEFCGERREGCIPDEPKLILKRSELADCRFRGLQRALGRQGRRPHFQGIGRLHPRGLGSGDWSTAIIAIAIRRMDTSRRAKQRWLRSARVGCGDRAAMNTKRPERREPRGGGPSCAPLRQGDNDKPNR
jgi:hypothetical protein